MPKTSSAARTSAPSAPVSSFRLLLSRCAKEGPGPRSTGAPSAAARPSVRVELSLPVPGFSTTIALAPTEAGGRQCAATAAFFDNAHAGRRSVRSLPPVDQNSHPTPFQSTSLPDRGRQWRRVRVYDKDRKELSRLCLAGIGADLVNLTGQLGEALSGFVDLLWPALDLTADRPLEHRRIDEGRFGMRVGRRVPARAVLDEHGLQALPGNVRQLVLVDESHLDVLRCRCIGESAAERHCGDKQRIEEASHAALSFAWRMELRLPPDSGGAIRTDRCGRGAR